jgi:hypothetical protein
MTRDDDVESLVANWDRPLFGWSDDIRPALQNALATGTPAVLATLCHW